LRHAEWIEFDIDGSEPLWRIPADKMKMGAQHIVPLSTQALILLRELHSVTGRGQYLFPSLRSGSKREQVLAGIAPLAAKSGTEFTISELEQTSPGVSRDMVRRVLREQQAIGAMECRGRGPAAVWCKKG
jgi:integrase